MRHSLRYVCVLALGLLLTTGCAHRRALRRSGNRPPRLNADRRNTNPSFLDDDGNNNDNLLANPNLFNEGLDPNIFNQPNLNGGDPNLNVNPGQGNDPGNKPGGDTGGNTPGRGLAGDTDRGAPLLRRLSDTSAAPSLRTVRDVTGAIRHRSREPDTH